MNLLSRAGMSIAVAQVRGTEASMRHTVNDLVSSGQWSGADAERFLSEWQELVTNRLLLAASSLERIDLNPFD